MVKTITMHDDDGNVTYKLNVFGTAVEAIFFTEELYGISITIPTELIENDIKTDFLKLITKTIKVL